MGYLLVPRRQPKENSSGFLAPTVREDASRETKTVLSTKWTGHLRELPEARGEDGEVGVPAGAGQQVG